jgi:hypothetical protein
MDQRTIKTKRIAEAIQEELSKGVSLKNGCAIISKREGMTSAAVKKCYQRCFSHPTKNHGNETLTIDQKTILTSMILDFSGCNLPLTPQQQLLFCLISIADSTLYRWLNSLKSQIKQKKTKVLSKKRMDPWIVQECAEFIASLQESQQQLPMFASNCVNYDETRLFVTTDGISRLERVDKNQNEMLGDKGELIGTFITFVGASRKVYMSCYVLKGEKTRYLIECITILRIH